MKNGTIKLLLFIIIPDPSHVSTLNIMYIFYIAIQDREK